MKYMYLVICFQDYLMQNEPMAVSTANAIFWIPSPALFKTELEAKTLCYKLKKDGVLTSIRKLEVGSYHKMTIKKIYGHA